MGTVILLSLLNASAQDYFQQEVNYQIHVTLDDAKHELNGFETVEYINNSHDTLVSLYFHLWPNAYSNNKTGLARQIFTLQGKQKLFNDPELRGYIDSLDFEAEGQPVKWFLLPMSTDICQIVLNRPLKYGDTIHITTPFHIKIPAGVTSLLGHTGESYNISQWYPKPAVYDRSGWHQMPYLDQGEFFSEFGNFDVSITLPANYIVAATGTLRNEEEKRMLDLLSEDNSWMNTPDVEEPVFPPSSKQMKTLRYTEDRIHDFAWFADKRFCVMKGSVKLPDSGREVVTWVMFTPEDGELWKDAISYVNSAILSFSGWIGDYPYDSFTAVQSMLSGGAGMEYPGLTVINHTDDPYLLDGVIAHEICHSWFYSSIGSNERRFPFMDESIVGDYELRYMNERYPQKRLWEIYLDNRKLADFLNIDEIPINRMQENEWLARARINLEQPVNLAAPEYSGEDYNIIIYNKGAQGFTWLRAYLGDVLFDSIMHDYYNTWKYKHPLPDDLRNIFESGTDKDLAWFFDDFLGTTRRLDYKLIRSESRKLLIKNRGELTGPLLIAEMNGDSVISEKWEEGFKGKKWFDTASGDYSEIKIDPGHKMPELFRLNNNLRTSGICRRRDPFEIRLFFSAGDPEKRPLIFLPVVDWNSTDRFMAGMSFHNGISLPKPVQFFVIPFYTFNKPGLAGYGKITFNLIPYDNIIRLARFSLEGSQFGAPGEYEYRKGKAGFDLYFRSGRVLNPVSQKVFGYYVAASDLNQIELHTQAKMRSYLLMGYMWERSGIINPFNLLLSLESGRSYQKTSLELNYKYSYYGRSNGLEIRLFAGTMLKNMPPDPFYAFSPCGRSGHEQYLYQGIYPDRFSESSHTFWSGQMALSEGGLVTPVNDNLGYSRSLCSVSFTSTLPGKTSFIPVKPFFTMLLNNQRDVRADASHFFFEAGFKAGIWNFLEFYFPLIVSGNIDAINGSLIDRIRFVFKLDIFNSLK